MSNMHTWFTCPPCGKRNNTNDNKNRRVHSALFGYLVVGVDW